MKTLLIDFDGVVHEYSSPWTGPGEISDGPVPGALEALKEYTRHFKVCIFSSRSSTFAGREAMKAWLMKHTGDLELIKVLEFPVSKPAGFLTIDDRCMCFEGEFPSVAWINAFRPWNKKGPPDAT